MSTTPVSAGAAASPPAAKGALAPFRIPIFRAIWIAALASNLGTWMQLVSASWLMTSLTTSAVLLALLSTASALPSVALALPAGAMADVLDRRRLIIVTQAIQLIVAALLGIITLAGGATPALLLALTLGLGIGTTLGLPAFSAITPELVGRDQLPAAISLNSITITLSQAVGPALGGLLVASIGSGPVFLLNAASFLGVIAVVGAWRRPTQVHSLPPEHIVAAMRTGARFTANAPALRAVLVRVAVCVLSYSALPALLAIITRERLGGSAGDYGLLVGCVGVGGVSAALTLSRLRARISVDLLVGIASIVFGAALWAIAALHSIVPAAPLLLICGYCQMSIMSSLLIGAQQVLPSWVRGRGLAVYQLTFQAGIAGGAALWGAIATHDGIPTALHAGGALLAVSALLGLVLRLSGTEHVDVSSAYQAVPYPQHVEPDPDDGPILVTVEYRVPEEKRAAFRDTLADLRRARRREGAIQWSMFNDIVAPERQLESYIVSSWTEHKRQGERRIASDQSALDRTLALHTGPDRPAERYLLGEHYRRGRGHRKRLRGQATSTH